MVDTPSDGGDCDVGRPLPVIWDGRPLMSVCQRSVCCQMERSMGLSSWRQRVDDDVTCHCATSCLRVFTGRAGLWVFPPGDSGRPMMRRVASGVLQQHRGGDRPSGKLVFFHQTWVLCTGLQNPHSTCPELGIRPGNTGSAGPQLSLLLQ